MSYKQLYSMSVLDLIRAGRLIAGTILAYATWPLYVRIDRGLRGRTWLSALLMTVLVVLVVVVPAVLVSLALVAELQSALVGFQAWLVGGGPSKLAGALRDIPWFGPR